MNFLKKLASSETMQAFKKELPQKSETVFDQFLEIFAEELSPEVFSEFSSSELLTFIHERFVFFEQAHREYQGVSWRSLGKGKICIDCCLKDYPFIVDSLGQFFLKKRIFIHQIIHPILVPHQDAAGNLIEITKAGKDDQKAYSLASCILEVGNRNEEKIEKLLEELEEVLASVMVSMEDGPQVKQMIERLSKRDDQSMSESLRQAEWREFFHWVAEGNMVLLGSAELPSFTTEEWGWDQVKQPTGILRYKMEQGEQQFPQEVKKHLNYFERSDMGLQLIETQEISKVYRQEKILLILYKGKTSEGQPQVYCFPALFRERIRYSDVLTIPIARLKLNAILERQQERENSYIYRAYHEYYNQLPKSELFRMDREELTSLLKLVPYSWERKQARVLTYIKEDQRYARVSVSMRGKYFNGHLLEQLKELITDTVGLMPEMSYVFHFRKNAYLHFTFLFPEEHSQLKEGMIKALEEEIEELTRSWRDKFREEAEKFFGFEDAESKIAKFRKAFTKGYQASVAPEEAVKDVAFLQQLIQGKDTQVDLRAGEDEQHSIVSLYSTQKYTLTDVMPILKNFSLAVLEESCFALKLRGKRIWVTKYTVSHPALEGSLLANMVVQFRWMFEEILRGDWENDPLNGLIVKTGLQAPEVELMVLYRNYYAQLSSIQTKSAINMAFLKNADVIRAFVKFFQTKFNPAQEKSIAERALPQVAHVLEESIHQVETLWEDQILKDVSKLLVASIRTNYYAKHKEQALAIKVRSGDVEFMPLPTPFREIFVSAPYLEGIHLRGGMVARGGLRHSDRWNDFRTEILGLMKTQMTKNSVIVPVGSKGGFITRRKVNSREESFQETEQQYRKFIQALLSVTDNIQDGEIRTPDKVMTYDQQDPYLVVAADKGTAHLSDVANEISDQNQFWLSDAFASGGSIGYNHKVVGITAKGAWECVKLHFLEMGKDIQTEDFTVVGIGDMGGDVFGNGMLLSRHICLQGAFNHRRIFLDPNPDAESTWVERKRLFDTPGTTWDDYKTELFSQGGGLFERSAKEITLSPEVQAMLETERTVVSGEELIRLLLRMKVELLWNGGIGTYIKASDEAAFDVGDPSNDAVRVDADHVQAQVIGEGGNLGLTQKARIEYALAGGRINTDSIDNSAGVDMSDHEVNLKILFSEFLDQGLLKNQEERNQLLEELTDEVAELCLEDNRAQSRILSLDALRSTEKITPFLQQISFLTKEGFLDRRTEQIPNDRDLKQAASLGKGIPRPVLSTLLSYTKMYCYNKLLVSPSLDDELLTDLFVQYFPAALQAKFDLKKSRHQLSKEIIATVLVNHIINQTGITFLPYLLSRGKIDVVVALRAYFIVEQLLESGDLRQELLQELPKDRISEGYQLLNHLAQKEVQLTAWLLDNLDAEDIQWSMIPELKVQLTAELNREESNLSLEEQQEIDQFQENCSELGLSVKLEQSIVDLPLKTKSLELTFMVAKTGLSLEHVNLLHTELGQWINFDALVANLMNVELESSQHRKDWAILLRKLLAQKWKIYQRVVTNTSEVGIEKQLESFVNQKKDQLLTLQDESQSLFTAEQPATYGYFSLIDLLEQISE